MSKQKHKASVTKALHRVASWLSEPFSGTGQSEKAVSLRPEDTNESELEAKREALGETEGSRVVA